MEIPHFHFPSLQELVSRYLFFQVKQAPMFIRTAKELPFELVEKILEVERRKFVRVSLSYENGKWAEFETTKRIELSKISFKKLLPVRKEYVKNSPDFEVCVEISSFKDKHLSFSFNNSAPSFPVIRYLNDIEAEHVCRNLENFVQIVLSSSCFIRANSISVNEDGQVNFDDRRNFVFKLAKIGCCDNCFRL